MSDLDPTKRSWTFGGYVFDTTKGGRLDELCAELKNEFPDLKFGHKRKVWWHWIFHVVICIVTVGFSRRYISDFTTTSKNRVDWSDYHNERLTMGVGNGHDRVWECLMHERVHLRQFAKYGSVLMALAYIHPPFIGLAYGRTMIEKPGYIESLRAKWVTSPDFVEGKIKTMDGKTYKQWWVGQFTGPNYGWMHLFGKKTVEGWFDREVALLKVKAA